MSLDATQIDDACATDTGGKRTGKARLLSLADIDRRTASYRRTCDLISGIEGDLGGAQHLTTGERQLAQRAAVTGALIEDIEARWLKDGTIDPALYCTLSNAQRRLFETIGLERRQRDVTPSLSEYLAAKAAEKPAHESTTGDGSDVADGAAERASGAPSEPGK